MYIPTHSLNSSEQLTQEEHRELFELCAQGDPAAREQIILAHLPLVVNMCKEHGGRGVPFDDLFQEGSYGLMVALDKYDSTKEKSFTEHAASYILKHIQKAHITQSSVLPIVYEEDFFYELQKYIRVLDDQTAQLSRKPTDTELARALRTTESKIRKLSHCLYSFFPEQDLVVASESKGAVPVMYQASPESDVLDKVLDLSCLGIKISQREQEILARRLGFTASGTPESIAEISEAMGITYEAVRVSYIRTIQKLQKAAQKKGFTISTIEV